MTRALALSSLTLAVALAASCGGADDNPGSTSSSSGSSGSTGGSSNGDAGPTPPTPGADTTVTPFDQTPIYFTADDNKRTVDAQASFPADGAYQSILLHLSLTCPSPGGCDAWDRFATLGVVTQKGATPDMDTVIEIARYITPYKVPGSWDIDVTDLRPILSGDITLRAFIDTWVGPGSPYGAGWLVTASFEMKGGIPAKLPVAVIPVWTQRYVTYGDPAKSIDGSVPPANMMIPTASSYALRTFVTGHGQGSLDNCAEFCARDHTITVNGVAHMQHVWRDDCSTTAVPNQQGTWKFPRAGWCPGADVLPWTLDITPDLMSASSVTVSYGVQDYVNTCRPDSPVCSGCSQGNMCPYDGGAHTEPNYQLSTVLVAYQ